MSMSYGAAVSRYEAMSELGGDDIDMFTKGPQQTRFQSSWTGRPVGTSVEKGTKPAFKGTGDGVWSRVGNIMARPAH